MPRPRLIAVLSCAAVILLVGCEPDALDALGPQATTLSPVATESPSSAAVGTGTPAPAGSGSPAAVAVPSRSPSATRTARPAPPPEPDDDNDEDAPESEPESESEPKSTPSQKPPAPTTPPAPTQKPKPDPDYTVYGRTELVAELNERRAAAGLSKVTYRAAESDQAVACAAKNFVAGTFKHCGYEVLYGASGGKPPGAGSMLDTWMASKPHRDVLLAPKLRFAGGGAVTNGKRTIAALTVAYK